MPGKQNTHLIAITGVGCRYPGGANCPRTFWDLVVQGKDVISDVPASRFDIDRLYSDQDRAPGMIRSRKGGFVEDIAGFDADFFGISPREATGMDPQQRLLLECALEALEDSGIKLEQIEGSSACVYVGSFNSDYETLMFQSLSQLDLYSVIGGGRYSMSNRLSYAFDLRGESMQIDTACSSALTGLHLACQKLTEGETDLALVGGSNLVINPYLNIGLSHSRLLSKAGRCNFGGKDRDGYVRSDGIGVIALRPLHVALRENNPVYALVLASGVNNDGKGSGLLLTPSADVQGELLEKVWAKAGVGKDDIGYVEAHGTGTRAGDPIELSALGAKMRGRSGRAYVGSVKSNIGHCEGGSGIPSIVKTALMIKHGVIAPSLVSGELCPTVDWSNLPLKIPSKPVAWPGDKRTAAVNSFGMTGTNVHVVLSSFEQARVLDRQRDERRTLLIPLTAKTRRALAARIDGLLRHLETQGESLNFYDLSYTLALRRNLFGERVAVAAQTLEELRAGLERELARMGHAADAAEREEAPGDPVFVFAGHGGQWAGMGRELYAAESVFRDAVDACDRIIRAKARWSLVEKIHADDDQGVFASTRHLQPAIFAIQVGLTELLRHYGVRPGAVIGHSLGEITACWANGACSLEDACELVLQRSRLMDRQQVTGKMLLVKAGVETLRQSVQRAGLDVATINGPEEFVVSGSESAVRDFAAALTASSIGHFELATRLPFHSRHFEAAAAALSEAAAGIHYRAGVCDFYSTVSGKKEDPQRLNGAHWGANVRSCVRFQAAVESAVQDGHRHFVEIGTHPVLIHALKSILGEVRGKVFSTLRKEHELPSFYQTLAHLFTSGAEIAFDRLYPFVGDCLSLPPYPFDHRPYWIHSETVARPVAIPIAPPVARPALEPPPASVKEGVRHLVQGALQRDAIGDNAPFSALGMDSLMSASLCKDIERAFGVELDYRTLWVHASVQRLSEWIEGKNRNQAGLLTKSLVSLHGDPSAPRKVVCFPCAGGSPAMFHGWGALVPSDVELLALQIPGPRELSSQDVPVTIEQYVAAVSPHVHERLRGNELHFVGHSMGAIVAYELARHLSASYGMMPVQLFAIASMAPEAAGRKTDFVASARDNLSVLFPSYSQPMESSVRDDLVELLMRDLKLLDSYEFDGENFAKLDIVGVLGAQDKALERQDMEGWARLSERHEQHLVEGDHVSVLNAQATLEILGRRLARETGSMRLSQ